MVSGTNFSADILIQNNSATVRSNINNGLNKSANITLYGLVQSFQNPKIMKDGIQCTNCYNFTSLNAGTVVFNVSSRTIIRLGGMVQQIQLLLQLISLLRRLATEAHNQQQRFM